MPGRSSRGRGARPTVRVRVATPAWRAVPAAAARARRAALEALGLAGAPAAQVNLLLADDGTLRALNRDFRGLDKATNVLAFPETDGSPSGSGDIAVAVETCCGEAAAQGKTPADHLSHLVVHGTLHLLGFDHEDAAKAEAMEALERRILAWLGVGDPYAAPGERSTHG